MLVCEWLTFFQAIFLGAGIGILVGVVLVLTMFGDKSSNRGRLQ